MCGHNHYMNTTPRPTILHDGDKLDPLTLWNPTKVTTRQLRPGMIVVDPDGFSCYVLDHRVGTDQGAAVWLAEHADTGRYEQITFLISRVPTAPVAAGQAN